MLSAEANSTKANVLASREAVRDHDRQSWLSIGIYKRRAILFRLSANTQYRFRQTAR
jgi:hypothetical protein